MSLLPISVYLRENSLNLRVIKSHQNASLAYHPKPNSRQNTHPTH